MKEFEMDGYKIRLKRTRYANNNSLAVLADYFDDEMNTWLPYMDVTTNIDNHPPHTRDFSHELGGA